MENFPARRSETKLSAPEAELLDLLQQSLPFAVLQVASCGHLLSACFFAPAALFVYRTNASDEAELAYLASIHLREGF